VFHVKILWNSIGFSSGGHFEFPFFWVNHRNSLPTLVIRWNSRDAPFSRDVAIVRLWTFWAVID